MIMKCSLIFTILLFDHTLNLKFGLQDGLGRQSYLHEGNLRVTLKIERWIKLSIVPYNTYSVEHEPEGNLEGNVELEGCPPPFGPGSATVRCPG